MVATLSNSASRRAKASTLFALFLGLAGALFAAAGAALTLLSLAHLDWHFGYTFANSIGFRLVIFVAMMILGFWNVRIALGRPGVLGPGRQAYYRNSAACIALCLLIWSLPRGI